MAKISKHTPFLFLALVAFLTISFQGHSVPMFGVGEKKPMTTSAEKTTDQKRRESDTTNNNANDLEGNDSSLAARGITCDATDHSLQNDQQDEEKEEGALTLENFRATAANPDFADVERLVIDLENNGIRPWSITDSKTKGKNEIIIAALKAALQAEYPRFSSVFINKIVEEELPPPSTKRLNLYWEKIIAPLSTATLQRILERADKAAAEQAFVDENSFTLQHFRNILANPENQEAERFIIKGEGASAVIVAQATSSYAEDTIIRKTLKRAIEREGHRRNFVHALTSEVLPRGIMTRARLPLSFEKLRTIIQKADDAMAEMKLLRVTRSIIPLSATAKNRAISRALLRSSIENFFNRLGIQNDILATDISTVAIPKSAEELAAEHTAAAQQAAWEQSEMEKVLRLVIHRVRNVDALKKHYHEAETAFMASEVAYHHTEKARREVEKKEHYLKEAHNFFEKAKAILDEKRELAELDEASTLNKISQGAKVTSIFLGMFNLPFVSLQGVADAVSAFATFADHRLTIAEAQKAYKNLQGAIQKAAATTEGYEQLEEAANKLQAQATAKEHLKKQEDHDETMRLFTLVKLPNDVDDAALRKWSTELTCEDDIVDREQANITAHLLYKQAKKNSGQIYELVSKLWGERVALLEQELRRLVEEAPSDEDYQSARKKEIEAKTNAENAKTRLKEVSEAKNQWFSKQEKLRREKKNLEKELLTAIDREARQQELQAKRQELSAHQTEKESIDSTYQNAATEAERLATAATIAHANAFEKFKIYNSVKQVQNRHLVRLQAAIEIEQKILDDILIAEDKRKELEACKALAAAKAQRDAALKQGDRKTETLQEEIVYELDRYDGNNGPGAPTGYWFAADEQAKGNRELANAYRKCAQAREARVVALKQGDRAAAKLQDEIRDAWGGNIFAIGAINAYRGGANEQAKGNREAANAYFKAAQARKTQAEALANGDKKAAGFSYLIAHLFGGRPDGIAILYAKAAEEQNKGNKPAANAYFKAAQVNETEAESFCNGEITTIDWEELGHKNEKLMELRHKQKKWINAAHYYSLAEEAQANGKKKPAQVYLQYAQSVEAAIEAIEQGDVELSILCEEREKVLSDGTDYARVIERNGTYSRVGRFGLITVDPHKELQKLENRAAALAQQIKALQKKSKSTDPDVNENNTTSPSKQNFSQQEKSKDLPSEKETGKCTIS